MRWMACAPLALAACMPVSQDMIARETARATVRPVLAQNFPGLPIEPATDCIIDNASAQEILAVAADATAGPTQSTADVVMRVAGRPETLNCLATRGLPAILQGV